MDRAAAAIVLGAHPVPGATVMGVRSVAKLGTCLEIHPFSRSAFSS